MAPPDDVAQDSQPLRLSELFTENSKQRRNDLEFNRRIYMVNNNPDFHVLMARTFKHYPGAATIALPDAQTRTAAAGPVALFGARRSVRRFDKRPPTLKDVATLLHLCAGLTGSLEDGPTIQPVRAAPSAGALFPIEAYLAVSRVEGVEAGVYHYRVDRHVLERVSSCAPGPALAEATFDPKLFGQAAAVLIFAGAFGRSYFKYGERGYRFALLEAGHICPERVARRRLAWAWRHPGRWLRRRRGERAARPRRCGRGGALYGGGRSSPNRGARDPTARSRSSSDALPPRARGKRRPADVGPRAGSGPAEDVLPQIAVVVRQPALLLGELLGLAGADHPRRGCATCPGPAPPRSRNPCRAAPRTS